MLIHTYYPEAERPNDNNSNTDSSGTWTFEGAGYGSSAGIPNGTYRFEAFNVDSNPRRLYKISDFRYLHTGKIEKFIQVHDTRNMEKKLKSTIH